MDLKITPSGQTIVKPTALGPVANTDSKLLIYGLFQKGRVLAQDAVNKNDRALRLCRRRDGWGRNGCAPQKVDPAVRDLLFCGSQLSC